MHGVPRQLLVVAFAILCVGAIVTPMGVAAGSTQVDAQPQLGSMHVNECAAIPPDDHEDPEGGTSEVIGWVDGFWYTESVDIEDPEALTEEELADLNARTAARVEALRCLTFEELPPIEFLTQEDYAEMIESGFEEEAGADERHFMNAQYATMFFVGTETDAVDAEIEMRSGAAGAFYQTEEEWIGFVTDDPEANEVDQVTLAHELLHALQDQHFDVGTVFDEETTDGFMSSLAVVEGEAVLVDGKYANNCGTWTDSCIRSTQAADDPVYWGLTLEFLAAYNSPLVAETYEEEGWEGVTEIHAEMPESMVEVMDPDQYGEFEPEAIEVTDASNEEWDRVTVDGQAYDTMGQHAMTATLMAPTFESNGLQSVIDPDEFTEEHAGGALNYDHSATSGWQADKLYAYENEAGDLGSVWKTAWADAEEAERFAEAYEDLIAYHGGEEATAYEDGYTFEQSDEYDMAMRVEQHGDRVWVAMAPTIEEIGAVHADLAPQPLEAAFSIEQIEPTEPELEPGDQLHLNVNIENLGDGADEQVITAQLGGEVVGEERLELGAGENEDVSFTVDQLDEDGEYHLEIVTEADRMSIPVNVSTAENGTDETDDVIPGLGPVAALIALFITGIGLRLRGQ